MSSAAGRNFEPVEVRVSVSSPSRRTVCGLLLSSLLPGAAWARDRIQIVGSSTAYPYLSAVAEHLAALGHTRPDVQSTGTDPGMEMFCGGAGEAFPDATSASDPMTRAQFDGCYSNNVRDIIHFNFGFEGVVLANSIAGPAYALTSAAIFLALAKNVPQRGKLVPNPYRNWAEIDPSLPNQPITVYGPPLVRGLRRYIEYWLMQPEAHVTQGKVADRDAWTRAAVANGDQIMRRDGVWIEYDEDSSTVLPILVNQPAALAFISYRHKLGFNAVLRAASINGAPAEFSSENASAYPLRLPLFLILKKQNLQSSPELALFYEHLRSLGTIGPHGYLARLGLAPLTSQERRLALNAASHLLSRPA